MIMIPIAIIVISIMVLSYLSSEKDIQDYLVCSGIYFNTVGVLICIYGILTLIYFSL